MNDATDKVGAPFLSVEKDQDSFLFVGTDELGMYLKARNRFDTLDLKFWFDHFGRLRWPRAYEEVSYRPLPPSAHGKSEQQASR